MNIAASKVSEAVGLVIGIVFISGLVIEFTFSRLLKKQVVSAEHLILNLSIASLQQITDVVNKVVFITAFAYVQQHCSIAQWLQFKYSWQLNPFAPSNGFLHFSIRPLVVFNYVFVLLLADFCQYWLHRFSHEVNIMWAGHITHHSNTEYNYGVALRQSAIENIYTWVFFMPLAFFGIPWQMFIAAYAISLIWQFLVHTQLVNKLGVLEYFMSTPSHHRVHHGKNPQYIDKNYGAFLIIWDKLFGSFEPEVEPVEYGITKPLENMNPVWCNVHHHVSIFNALKSAESRGKKWRVLFGAPVVMPVTGNTGKKAKHITFTAQPEKKGYVFINYLLAATATFWAINYSGGLKNTGAYLIISAIAVFQFSLFAALLQNKRWADYAEVIRLCVIAVVGVVVLSAGRVVDIGTAIITTALLLLLFTQFIAARYRKNFATT
ncbi:MAG TPA: sterol desaturase family protein [Chitinophagales bacterium]|nr:sterol desaturase family protein [Chitinophagales bacterium]